MFYLFLITLTSATAEYFYFTQRLTSQRMQILTLTAENNKLRSKINKRETFFAKLNIKHSEPPYKYGFAMENTTIRLLPVGDSPVVHKCLKSVRVNVLYEVDVHGQKWYEVAITINSDLVKGYIEENGVKFIVEESC